MVWYTQVEIVLVISILTRIFRYLNNKIDLADFQKGEGASLKSENVWTKVSGLLREALRPAASLKKKILDNSTLAMSFVKLNKWIELKIKKMLNALYFSSFIKCK